MADTIRMVHPTDPKASADGFERDKDGALQVPEARVADLKAHGFEVELLADKGKRAEEAAIKAERRRKRQEAIDAESF